ncbi:MAG TPA: multicopper oxidase domain-containing protein [Anaeromyxobacteraceae bacterium]|nr:multicopper oxidase domain-containing protein [Anaeromyxobacteraceae bacterium]
MTWAAVAALAILTAGSASAQLAPPAPAAQVQLPGNRIAQFVDPLPQLSVAGGTIATIVAGPGEITLNMHEFKANIMPSIFVPAIGTYTGTWVFGYLQNTTAAPLNAVDTNVGPVIVATRHQPTQVRYVNNLRANNIHWRDWIDQSLHWANPGGVPMELSPGVGNPALYAGPVPAVPHLHGGEVPAAIDGGPEAWFLSDEPLPGYTPHGAAYYTKPGVPAASFEAVYRYPNSQEAAPLWFHDHLLGGTRINATFAGLAGAYPIIDPGLALPQGLHPVGLQNANGPVRFLVPLVIQDRMFDTNGQLFFPKVGINPDHPYWVPEFVGDTIIVNGKVWPFLNVDRQRYRFYLIDGSNSRPYDMFLQDPVTGVKGPPMWVIANDGGYLDRPVLLDPNATGAQAKAGVLKSLFMMPGERYEIIVDFNDPVWIAAQTKAYAGRGVPNPVNLILRNTAPTVDGNPKSATDGRVMQFRVSATAPGDSSYDPASGIPLRPAMVRLANAGTVNPAITPALTRELTLVEIVGAGGPLEVLVNNTKWNGMHHGTGTPIPGSTLVNGLAITEVSSEGATEVWEIVNTTADAHPIHLHGIQFQILNRQSFNVAAFFAAYTAAFGGMFMPGHGPPLAYGPSPASGGKYGGNPDVAPFLVGLALPPAGYESGWKDTAVMPSGFVTRIVARYAPQDTAAGATGSFIFKPNAPATNGEQGYYVWHCHITDHEDNEMMRPTLFAPNVADSARTYVQGTHF